MMYVLFGFIIGLALAWPRVTPQVRYYADPARGLYHGTADCDYTQAPALRSREQAGNLKPCPFCLPEQAQQVAETNEKQGQHNPDEDMSPVASHRDAPPNPIGRRRG